MQHKWYVIFNPTSGGGKAKKDEQKIKKLLTSYQISTVWQTTKKAEHAMALTKKGIDNNFYKFLVIGGDGTLNEVVNGLMQQKQIASKDALIAVIPVGSGNDWIKTMGTDNHYLSAIKIIKTGKPFLHDVGKIKFTNQNTTRYFINMASFGFGGYVVKKIQDKRQINNRANNYKLSIFRHLFKYQSQSTSIENDKKRILNEPLFSFSLGIGRYNGNGMMQAPNAIPDDGILELTAIKKVSRWTVIKHTGKLKNGSFVKLPFVEQHSGKSFTITANASPILIEADGESIGQTPVVVTCINRAIKVLANIANGDN